MLPWEVNHVLRFKTEFMEKKLRIFCSDFLSAKSFIYKDKYILCKIGTAHMKMC